MQFHPPVSTTILLILLSCCWVCFVVVGGFDFDRTSCGSLLPNQGLHPAAPFRDNGRLRTPGDNDDDDDRRRRERLLVARFTNRHDDEYDDAHEEEDEDEDYNQDVSDSYTLKPSLEKSPFVIKTDVAHYRRNRPLIVRIKGGEFNGFMLVAQPAVSAKPQPVGLFTHLPATAKHLSCYSNHDTAINKDTGGKSDLKFEWKAPNADKGTIMFKATVVRNQFFWANIQSNPITFNQFPPSFADCGQSKSCYRYSTKIPNCEADQCDYVVITKITEENEIEFTIGGVIEGNNGYIGIGFTLDSNKMSHMDVGACVKNGATVEAHQYTIENWNRGPHEFHQVSDLEGTDVDGDMIWCQYRRPLKGPGAHLADLTQTLHHAFLWGSLNTSTSLPILPSKQEILFVPEPWNHSNTISMMHYVGGRASSIISVHSSFSLLLCVTVFLQSLNSFV